MAEMKRAGVSLRRWKFKSISLTIVKTAGERITPKFANCWSEKWFFEFSTNMVQWLLLLGRKEVIILFENIEKCMLNAHFEQTTTFFQFGIR